MMESSSSSTWGRCSAVTLDDVPQWSDMDLFPSPPHLHALAHQHHHHHHHQASAFHDPLSSPSSPVHIPFPADPVINSKLYLWTHPPWNLDVDAVVNSTNESLDVNESSAGLHVAAGPELALECSSLGGCRTGMAQITRAYNLPARRVIHTVGPKYVEKYRSAAENALCRCYQSCLELLLEHNLHSIAFVCIYAESKGYPREQAAHVALRTVRQVLAKHKDKVSALVFCPTAASDVMIYERLMWLYFPRTKLEEDNALLLLPKNTRDENDGTIVPDLSDDLISPLHSSRRLNSEECLVDPLYLSMLEDPDTRRVEQWKRATKAYSSGNWLQWKGPWNHHEKMLDEHTFRHRYLARAKAVDLSEISQMKILYHSGSDVAGRPVMVVVGAHFLLRCLDLEQFLLFVIKEFNHLIHSHYTVVYFHSAAALQLVPDFQWMRCLQKILGNKHKTNLHRIYMVHPTLGLKATVLLLRLLVDSEVWRKVTYIESLPQLYAYIAKDQLKVPEFIFQHDMDVHGRSF